MSSTKTTDSPQLRKSGSKGLPQPPNSASRKLATTSSKSTAAVPATAEKAAGKRDRESKDEKKKSRRHSRNAKGGGEGSVDQKGTGGAVVKKQEQAEKGPRRSPKWRLSPALGGRFSDLDPVFSKDEKYILLAKALSIQIFSTKTSLLVRTISMVPKSSAHESVVSYILDEHDDHRVYVATSTSCVFLWDWIEGTLVDSWNLDFNAITQLCLCTDEKPQRGEENTIQVVYAVGTDTCSHGIWRIQLSSSSKWDKIEILQAPTSGPFVSVRVLDGGNLVAGVSGNKLTIANKFVEGEVVMNDASGKAKWGHVRVFPMAFELACMDTYLPTTEEAAGTKKKGKGDGPRLGDVVIGDVSGAMHVFHDILRWKDYRKAEPVIRRLHWHRTGVLAVKWALDGNYILSGGQETVLVLWQIETSHKQYLPHLGATINKIVVSPRGSSYAIGLSDNSIMILSTTELKPKANIAGIQSRALIPDRMLQTQVPCILHPIASNKLLIATPSSQTSKLAASPYLQTFDTFSNRQISRQALTRTNVTTANCGPEHDMLVEPNLVYLAITADGEWLATIDEWKPPRKELSSSSLGDQKNSPVGVDDGFGREVFLKFWKWNEKNNEWDLVTRVDSPHPSSTGIGAEKVFDLIATPRGHGFATCGADGSVRIWRAKIRARAGVQVRGEDGVGLVNWGLRKSIRFSKSRGETDLTALTLSECSLSSTKKIVPWGKAAFSEDGSVLAVSAAGPSFGAAKDSIIHFVNPDSATVHQSVSGLRVGKTNGLAIVDRYLIILGTAKLLVWNLVSGSVEWEFTLDELSITCPEATEGGQLAVDHQNRTFAVGFMANDKKSKPRIFIFEANNQIPLHIQRIDMPITALKAAGGGKGYMFLDTQARVQYLSPALAPHFSMVQAMTGEFRITDDNENGNAGELSGLYNSNDPPLALAVKNGILQNVTQKQVNGYTDDDDGVVDRVVSKEAVEMIFDSMPSYAAGPLEEAFEKLLGLFAKKPLSGDVEEEEEEGKNEDEGVEGNTDENEIMQG